ncbi:MAG: hypothetical protein ACP5QG_07890 [candidate division WOR-3 bacterium]
MLRTELPLHLQPPTIDGALNPGEWADAIMIDFSDTLAWDGYQNNSGDCLLYIKHDETP